MSLTEIELEKFIGGSLDLDTILTYDEVLNTLRELSIVIEPEYQYPPVERDDSKLWPGWFSSNGVNTVLNREFVEVLYREMSKRRLSDQPMIEICAGRGKLSYQLRKLGVDIVPTDDYSQEMQRDETLVERATHLEALEKYEPRIVVASWISRIPEIGDDVLNFPSVDYFIDIGETAGGSTWLRPDYRNPNFKYRRLADVDRYAIGTSDYFGKKLNGEVEFVRHTEARLWKRKGAPMSINNTV